MRLKRNAKSQSGHVHDHSTPDVMKEMAAVLVQTKNSMSSITLANADDRVLAVNPVIPMRKLNDVFLSNFEKLMLAMSSLILLVSGVSIFVSIYNSMADRRHEISVMRALGAARRSVFAIILAESLLLCMLGGLLGFLLGHGLVFAITPMLRAKFGLVLDPFHFDPYENARTAGSARDGGAYRLPACTDRLQDRCRRIAIAIVINQRIAAAKTLYPAAGSGSFPLADSLKHMRTRCATSSAPVFVMTFARCASTVLKLTPSSAATCRLDSPFWTSPRTCRSRGVRRSSRERISAGVASHCQVAPFR